MQVGGVVDLNSGVQYYFDETTGITGGNDSGWQDSTAYSDFDLHSGYAYGYRVKARNTSAGLAETGYSTTAVVNTFSDLLSHNTPKTDTRIPNRYAYFVYTNQWSVVAIASASDHDIVVSANTNFTSLLESSSLSGSPRDFVSTNTSYLDTDAVGPGPHFYHIELSY